MIRKGISLWNIDTHISVRHFAYIYHYLSMLRCAKCMDPMAIRKGDCRIQIKKEDTNIERNIL